MDKKFDLESSWFSWLIYYGDFSILISSSCTLYTSNEERMELDDYLYNGSNIEHSKFDNKNIDYYREWSMYVIKLN